MVAFKNSNLERILKTYSEVDRNLYRTKISRKTKWKLIHERTFADFGRVSNETVFIHLGTHEVKTIGKVDGAPIDGGSKVLRLEMHSSRKASFLNGIVTRDEEQYFAR